MKMLDLLVLYEVRDNICNQRQKRTSLPTRLLYVPTVACRTDLKSTGRGFVIYIRIYPSHHPPHWYHDDHDLHFLSKRKPKYGKIASKLLLTFRSQQGRPLFEIELLELVQVKLAKSERSKRRLKLQGG